MKLNKEAIKTVALALIIGLNAGFVLGTVYAQTNAVHAQATASK